MLFAETQQVADHYEESDDDALAELRHNLFATLEAAATGVQSEPGAAQSASATCDVEDVWLPQKRAHAPVVRLDPATAEIGGGGWSAYDRARIGKRHKRVRDRTYDELCIEVEVQSKLLAELRALLNSPDRSANAIMERVAAIALFAAQSEECDAEPTAASDSLAREDSQDIRMEPASDADGTAAGGMGSTSSTAWCGCERCARFDFRRSLMSGIGGMPTQLEHVKVQSVTLSGRPSQAATLEEFAKTLASGQLRAVRVDSADLGIEGSYWLCDVMGRAVQATERQAQATDLFEAGWWIVDIVWWKLVEDNSKFRKYERLPRSRRWLSVTALIRVTGLQFEGGRTTRSATGVLSRDHHDLLVACL